MARKKRIDPFFTSFNSFATVIEGAAESYSELVRSFPSDSYKDLMSSISYAESQGDGYVKDITDRLVTSFSTPFDREDINDLVLAMDDILDYIEGAAMRLDLFNIHEMRDEAVRMSDLTLKGAHILKELIGMLPEFESGGDALREKCHELQRIEHDGDETYQKALYRLFHEDDGDADISEHVEHVTWLRLFDRMEYCLDAYDKVASVVRRIVIKNA